MNDWKRIPSILLLPLNLCGGMFLMAFRSVAIRTDLRWRVLALGMVLSIPGIIFMILTLAHRREDDEEEGDGSEDLELAHSGFGVESLAKGEGRGEQLKPAPPDSPQTGRYRSPLWDRELDQ
jgi:hypothetical protein